MNLESRILASQPTIPWVTTCKLAALNSVFLSVKWGSFPSLPPTSKAYKRTIHYLTTSNCGTFCAVTIPLSAFPLKARSFHFVIILGFGRLSLTAGGLFRGVCRQGFSATRPAAWCWQKNVGASSKALKQKAWMQPKRTTLLKHAGGFLSPNHSGFPIISNVKPLEKILQGTVDGVCQQITRDQTFSPTSLPVLA